MTRIVWFSPRPWAPPRRGADVRTQGLVRTAISAGHEVLVVSPGTRDTAAPDLGAEHVDLGRHATSLMWAATKIASRHPLRAPRATRASLTRGRAAITRFAPEVAVVSEVMSWSLASRLAPEGTPLVYDAHNVEQILYRALSEQATGPFSRATAAVDAHRVASAEKALFSRAALVMAVSDDDASLFARLHPGSRPRVVPSSVPTPATPATPSTAPPACLFVGSLDYAPNGEAVTELVREVLPSVRRAVPGATFVIVGRGAEPGLRRLISQTPGASLHDDVDDLSPVYRAARCVVAPIRSGGGTKLKAFEAMAFGVPLVGTSETVRGIDVRAGEAVVADSVEDIVSGTVELLRDPGMASKVGTRGRQAFEERLSWGAVRRPLDEALEAARQSSPRASDRP